jgi:sugar lactone lactonase YvrE
VLVSIVEAAIGGVALWRWWQPRARPLDPNWTANVAVVAGDGTSGTEDADAAHARWSDPFGIAAGRDGTVYVADAGVSQRIRALTPDGRVITIAGSDSGFADGPARAARFNTPSGLAIDASGALYVADTGNNAIRRIAPDGQVTTVAGDPEPGYRDGRGRDARFNGPIGVAVDSAGRVIVADTYNDRIRVIDQDGMVRTIAGSASGHVDGMGIEAQFDTPCGVAVDRSGNILVADTANGAIRTIDSTGRVTTMSVQGPLARPIAVTVDAAGNRYVVDEHGRVIEIAADGTSRVVAGSGAGFADGSGADARFRSPHGIAVVGPARLIVADSGNALLRLVGAASAFEPRLPPSPRIAPHFDVESFASMPLLWPVAPLEGPHEVAGTIGEARGVEGAERFHAGIDVRSPEGTIVQAVRAGVVASPISTGEFGTINEWVRIGAMAYVHTRVGREANGEPLDDDRFVPRRDATTGKLVGMRVKRGARFATGEAIGSINAFNHVHMNVGWPGEEYNPLEFRLVRFEDTIPPTIPRGGVRLIDELGNPLKEQIRGRLVVSGRVQIVVDAWDEANGNRPGRRLGLYDLGFQVLNRDGSPAAGFEAVRHTLRFDRLSLEPDAARLVYAPGSGIPYYRGGRTKFLYIVTDSFHDGVATPGLWDTTSLPPGDYIVRVWAADFSGNTALMNRDVAVTIVAPATATRAAESR